MKKHLSVVLVLVIVAGLLLPGDVQAFGSLPPGFADREVVPGISKPTSIAWLPNDTMLVTSQNGQVFRDNGGAAVSILNLGNAVCVGNETGLLGMAVDPNFPAQPFVYLYYTHHKGGGSCNDAANRANRVSRFTMDGAQNLGSEQVLLDNISAKGGNHNGGDLQFGKDGLLYISVGDAGQDLATGEGQDGNANARRLSLLNGKILRITPEGGIPASNPFTGPGSAPCAAAGRTSQAGANVSAEKRSKKAKKQKRQKQRKKKKKRRQLRGAPICQEIFATGLRNPYRIAFDPDDGTNNQRFFINDVGGSAWEEIDEGAAGADYGWNVREGPCRVGATSNCDPDGRFTGPLFAYTHQDGCSVITGGAFVPNGPAWPSEFHGQYLFADLGCQTLFAISDQNPGASATVFGTGSSATHLAFGPDGQLYYTDFGTNAVHKIVYSGS